MKPYALIDLHCDTLTACDLPQHGPNTLDDPQAVLSLSNLPAETRWAQCFALFLPDKLPRSLLRPHLLRHPGQRVLHRRRPTQL